MMVTMNGSELLQQYRQHGSENAFSELVRRFGDLVYSVAKRRVQDTAVAEEVAQNVFTRLAKAAPNCSSDGELIAWLHRTTLHVAIDAWRSETRRRARELHAAAMEPALSDEARLWDELAPHLDEALNELKDLDRQAILLRFFQQKPMRDIGHALGITEDAAKMRVGRALDRLRESFVAKGVACTAVGLAAAMSGRVVEAAPAQVISSLYSLSALASSGSGGAGAWSLLCRFLLMSAKTKIITGVVVLGLFGIALHRALSPGSADRAGGAAPQSTEGTQRIGTRLATRTARQIPFPPIDAVTPAELEDLKAQLRALLQRPPPAKGYPPTPVRKLLAKFGDQVLAAVPILLEGLAVPDYETRLWAAGGLKVIIADYRENRPDLSRQAFQLARSAFAPILQSEREPDLLRMVTIEAFIPAIIYDAQGAPLTLTDMFPGADEDVIAALRATEKRGFRFTIVEKLTHYLQIHPEQTATFRAALEPMLNDPKPAQRFVAAYALASWPGDKPEEVKRELLRQLKKASPNSYNAARALGRLDASASDAVPELLAYAERTKQWTAGYASSALEAACRLRPELRAQFPEIDQKLKVELAPVPQNLPSVLLKPDSAQDAPPSEEEPPAHARPVALVSLTLDARVLLVEQENPNRDKIERVLHQFDGPGGMPDTKTTVTPDNYAQLSKALRDVDAPFEAEWRKTVSINYPWLDRVLPNRF
jgi:RNA polymerase sigma factor (sigma-70 family)